MRARLIAGLLYLIAALVVYGPTLTGRFIGDDFIWLHDAAQVESPVDLFRLHHADFAPNDGIRLQPLTLGFFWVCSRLFDLNPLPYHCAAIALVALNALLLHLWVQRLTDSDSMAAVAGITFLVHPMHREPGGWLSAVNEPLLGAAALACLLAFARARETGSRTARLASWLALMAALMAKESAATLPLVLLAADLLLFAPQSWKQRLRTHLPLWGILGAAIAWQHAAIVAARGATYTVQHPNGFVTAAAGTIRYVAGLLLGFDAVAIMPPAAETTPTLEGRLTSLLTLVLYVAACVLVASAATRAHEPDTDEPLRGLSFHLAWLPLATLPYALLVPGAPLQTRYAWQGTLALGGAIGCGCALLARTPVLRLRLGAALCVVWLTCAWNLNGTLRMLARPDDTPILTAQVREAAARLGDDGKMYVYQRPGEQHSAGRAAALFADLSPDRIGDWYDVLAWGLALDDVMLFYDPTQRAFTDLTPEVRRALNAPRHAPTSQVDGVSGLPLLRTWDMHDRRDREAWTLDGLSRDADGPIYHPHKASEALVSPELHLSPFDALAVQIDYEIHDASGGAGAGQRFLGWSSPLENGWGPSRFVEAIPGTREGRRTAWFYPPSRASWWREGGARRLYFAPSTVPADVRVDRISIWAPDRKETRPR